jgi:hypothetical protein
MVKTKLVEELIKDGGRLLRQLDRSGFPVETMAWVHLADEGYWRLAIASPVVGLQGGAVGYRQLNELLYETELAGITLEDITLLDPAAPQFESMVEEATASSRLAAGSEWLEFEDAVVYRWNSASLSAELTCNISAEELTALWEAERRLAPGSHPAVLFALSGRRVTMRFHPQHGVRGGIENIKSPFQIALHRPGARPDCEVSWLK